MKNNKSLLEKLKMPKWAFLVRHVSGLYVGKESEQKNHWLLYALPENATQYNTREEAEAFIKSKAYWLQEFLSVEKVYAKCTQEDGQSQHLEYSNIAPWK